MSQIAKDYTNGTLIGWGEIRQPGLVKSQFNLLKGSFKSLSFPTVSNRKTMLYQLTRLVLGKDTDNYAQEIGDCVSQGAKNATEYLTCAQIAANAQHMRETGQDYQTFLRNARIQFRKVFPPYYYGTGRVYVGGGRLGNDDGSLGSWMAEAVMKYGTLFSDEPNVPSYSGDVAKSWGDPDPRKDLDKFKETAKAYPVKSAALITTWDELVGAIANLYPCTTASNVGYDMEPSSDGFHRQTESWAHQMCFIGVDDNDRDPYAILLNSWGAVHGNLKDFDTGEDLPVGVLRVRRKDVEKHLREQETFAYSQFDGFPAQDLDKSLFMLV